MKISPPLVVAVWGCLNGALVAVLAGFGAKPVVLAIYASAAVLVELFAVTVWYSRYRRRIHAGRRHLPNGDSVPLYAAAVLITGLAFAFYWPLAPLALAPLFVAVMHQMSQRRRGA